MAVEMAEAVRRAMAPTRDEIRALPQSSSDKMALALLRGRSGRVLDVGCGTGKFTRSLAALFGEVSGIDVKAKSIATAVADAAAAGLAIDFRVAGGEKLPYPDGWFDTVIFSNSLHHMPDPGEALREAVRVLQPDGILYVMEPVPAGSFHEATRLVNDETTVRTQAYVELRRLPAAIEPQGETMCRSRVGFAGFGQWHADQVDRDPARQALFDAQPEEVRRQFEGSAVREDGRLVFDQILRVNWFRKRVAA
jgi:SAM-dependent methyltransferase